MAKSTKTTKKKHARKHTARVVKVTSKKAFSTYDAAIEYLLNRTDYEKETPPRYNASTFNLDRMQQLLTFLGNPQNKIRTVHIAGTKGKGSTATMLARMLQANGYKVGLYTSPHVTHLHERIAVNSVIISEEEMLNLINRIHASVEKIAKTDQPSFFEVITALAFMHFADVKADIAIIETGLGGRLDSTNVITPELVGITSLSIDHQKQLGNTVESIAKEKAGIFKSGVPVITVQQPPEALNILKNQALAAKAPLSITGKDIDFSYRFEMSREHGPHMRICLSTKTSKFEHLRVPLHGRHQAINCGLALAMLDRLKSNGYNIDNEKVANGLNEVFLPGRMEMVCHDPRIMVDGAHNAASIEALMQAIGQNIPYDSMIVIFGCNNDKDILGMMQQLQYGADKVIFTRSSSAKAASPQVLADVYTEICGKMCQTASCLGEAIQLAQNAIGREDLICITGSFYLVGQARARFAPGPVIPKCAPSEQENIENEQA